MTSRKQNSFEIEYRGSRHSTKNHIHQDNFVQNNNAQKLRRIHLDAPVASNALRIVNISETHAEEGYTSLAVYSFLIFDKVVGS